MRIYADSSALVKLFLEEHGSSEMQEILQGAELVASSRIAYAELRAALASAVRGGRIAPSSRNQLVLDLDLLWEDVLKVSVDEPVVRQAGDLAERMRLRGYDAVHLSALITVGPPSEFTLACWDAELRRAAGELGYSFIPS